MNARKSLTMALATGSVLLVGLSLQQAQAASASTAQSAMLTIDAPSNISIVDKGAYAYNRACAATWFSCETETIQYSEGGCKGSVLNDTTVSSAVPQSFINANSCNILNGEPLEANSPPKCTGKILTKTTCEINPNRNSDSCLKKMEDASLTLQGKVASESVILSGTNKRPLLKYSFNLGDPEYSLSHNGTRVVGLRATLKGGSINVSQNEDDGDLVVELLDENIGIDFTYSGRTAATGNVGLLTSTDGKTYNESCDQETPRGVRVKDILGPDPLVGTCASSGDLKDTSRANDEEGGDLVTWRTTDPIFLDGPGTYGLSVTGTIKSLDGLDDLGIVAKKNIQVEDCSTQ